MQVTVKDNYINVRTGLPSVNAPTTTYLSPGTQIEIDGQLYNGDLYDGVDTWVKDDAGNFYWSGGVNHTIQYSEIVPTTPTDIDAFVATAQYPLQLINWNSRIVKLPPVIRNNFGYGIAVGVLDSGVEKTHLDLAKCLSTSVDFTSADAGDSDQQGHGTMMISLIAASSFSGLKGIIGVAPQAIIHSAKVVYDRNAPPENSPLVFQSVLDGLNYAFNNNADIVNLSFDRSPDFEFPEVKKKISDLIENATKTVFVAATKEDDEIQIPSDLVNTFPANCSNIIRVCSLTHDYVNNNWDNLPTPLVIVPAFQAWCCSIAYDNYYSEAMGSSVSTALVSGIITLLLADNQSLNRTSSEIIKELVKYSSTVDEAFNNPGNEVHIIVKI